MEIVNKKLDELIPYASNPRKNDDAVAAVANSIRGAQWPRKMNYNDGADWWLRRNAKKYGLKYSRTKTVEGGLR